MADAKRVLKIIIMGYYLDRISVVDTRGPPTSAVGLLMGCTIVDSWRLKLYTAISLVKKGFGSTQLCLYLYSLFNYA